MVIRSAIRWSVLAVFAFGGCSPGQFDAPALDSDVQAELAAQSVATACAAQCAGVTFVIDQQANVVIRGEGFRPMSAEMRSALETTLESVEFIGWERAIDVIDDPPNAAGASLLVVGAIEYIADYTAAVELGMATGSAPIDVLRFVYRWDRDHWKLREAE